MLYNLKKGKNITRNNIIKKAKKGLVCAVIILFIGVSFQPAIAIDVKSSIDNTEEENDCGCGTISKVQRIRFEKLLNRLEIHTNKLPLLFKDDPKLQEKYKELSYRITTIKNMKYSFPLYEFSNICSFLEAIFNPLVGIFDYLDGIWNGDDENLPPLLKLIGIAITPLPILLLIILYMGLLFECDFIPHIPNPK